MMIFGLIFLTSSQPRPHRSSVPGVKFSNNTSACLIISFRMF